MPENPEVCIEVPTYNERENIASFLDAVRAARGSGWEVLFVDDSSPDGTAQAINEQAGRDPTIHLMVRKEKMGIGSAHQAGFREAIRSLSPAIIVQMDADLQHPPSFIGKLVSTIEEGADVAVGSRYVPGGGSTGWSLWRRTVSRGANFYARTMLGLKVKDATSGFKAYSREAAERIAQAGLPTKGFEFQVACIRLLQKDMKIVEVPYTFSSRAAGVSKLKFADVMRFIFSILRMSFS